jgi:hypothetical protein
MNKFNEAIQMVVVVNLMMVEVVNNFHLMLVPVNIHPVHMKMKMMKEVIGDIFHMNDHLNRNLHVIFI